MQKKTYNRCSLCDGIIANYGNNAWPLSKKRCCDGCNITRVIPARMAKLYGEAPIRNEEAKS